MLRILIPFFVAATTTYGCWLWQMCQTRATGNRRDITGWLRAAFIGWYVVWTIMMTLLVWVGFMDPVRSLAAYPFGRLGVSLLVGSAFVAAGAVMGVLFAIALGNDGVARKPTWRRLNPIGCQLIFILFSGLAFQHSSWGGPP